MIDTFKGLFEHLKTPENRKNLAQYIQDNVPELIECDPNNHIHNMIDIIEYNSPNGGYTNEGRLNKEHYFALVIRQKGDSTSCQHLYDLLLRNEKLEDIEKMAKIGEWGYKMADGWKYPNLGLKVKNTINTYLRKIKINYIHRNV